MSTDCPVIRFFHIRILMKIDGMDRMGQCFSVDRFEIGPSQKMQRQPSAELISHNWILYPEKREGPIAEFFVSVVQFFFAGNDGDAIVAVIVLKIGFGRGHHLIP